MKIVDLSLEPRFWVNLPFFFFVALCMFTFKPHSLSSSSGVEILRSGGSTEKLRQHAPRKVDVDECININRRHKLDI